MIRVSINTGFITNSSSVVHGFDRALLEDEEVRTFMETYGLLGGLEGNPWRRDSPVIAVTEEQVESVKRSLTEHEYAGSSTSAANGLDPKEHIVVIYGDEYRTVANELCGILSEAAERLGKGSWGSIYFN